MRDQHIRYGEGFGLVYSITQRTSFIALQDHYGNKLYFYIKLLFNNKIIL